eukprot:10225908-Prorocentrum_lima.AAC.1
MGELVAKLEQEKADDQGDMLPPSPVETLSAAGQEAPVLQPLPRAPKDATAFIESGRPAPRTS